jgi:hypothetical protein
MQRWEYRVISLADGRYTTALNEYGQDGWELVSVVENPPKPAGPSGSSMPGTLGRLEDATSKLTNLGGDSGEAPSTLLWVLRRPLDDA